MKDKKLSFKPVLPEDFDARLLRRAAREGRLFITDPEEATGTQPSPVERILAYVESIAPYALCTQIRDIWEAILHDKKLAPLFLFNRYHATRGQVNWYRVTAVVCLLREKGVYRQDLTALQLHLKLEGSTRRTPYYNGMNRYLLEKCDRDTLRQILDKFRQ